MGARGNRLARTLLAFAIILLPACVGILSGVPVTPALPQTSATNTAEWPANTFAVLCFHDIQDDLLVRPDSYTVSTRNLALDLSWLYQHDYHVITLDDVIESRLTGGRALPSRAVLLSFDDGLESTYSRAFPLLEAFHYPAIVGLVGSWLEPPDPQNAVDYGDAHLKRGDFVTGEQIHEMQRSGLIEFASHTYGLHRGITANPQHNQEPAVVSRWFQPNGQYEDPEAYRLRLRTDLAHNNAMLETLTGKRPRLMVWPYGAHNHVADAVATEQGMPYALTLERGLNTPDVPLSRMRRMLITHDFTPADFSGRLQHQESPEPLRVMQIDLDSVYDADAAQQEKNLSALLDRVKASGINTVYLQAYADPDGAGVASALYFPNRHMPMRADLFNRVAWQLRTRTGVGVYAWLPLLAYALPASDRAADHWVVSQRAAAPGDVKRLSPFDSNVRQAIREIYEDLALGNSFQGLLFSDDATLDDFEDAGPAALATYAQWGLPADVGAIRSSPETFQKWSQLKIAYLTAFSLELAQTVRADHGDLRTARNLFARVVIDPRSQSWMGQSLGDALKSYDYVALMAMPYMEGERGDSTRWLTSLTSRVATYPEGLNKTVFELQSVDWAQGHRRIPDAELVKQIRAIRTAGARSFGYYPDDFIGGQPSLEVLKPALSMQSFPDHR